MLLKKKSSTREGTERRKRKKQIFIESTPLKTWPFSSDKSACVLIIHDNSSPDMSFQTTRQSEIAVVRRLIKESWSPFPVSPLGVFGGLLLIDFT